MRIVIIGLPLFAERLAKALIEFDRENTYIHLDTYYKKSDQLKALWHIPRADCVISINGTITPSRAFDLAFKKKVPVIMNWVGTDVLKSTKAFNDDNFQQHYIDNAAHFCEVEWIQDELKQIGINADIVNFAGFNKSFELKQVTEKKLNILSYVADHRAEFYGIKSLIRMAEKYPSMHFRLVGTEASEYQPLPRNMEALGWVKNMDEVYDKSHACIRYTEHDGLSTFILESLARGKQVLYRNPFEQCLHCPEEEDLAKQLLTLQEQLNQGADLINRDGAEMIRTKFNKDVIYGELLSKVSEVVGKS